MATISSFTIKGHVYKGDTFDAREHRSFAPATSCGRNKCVFRWLQFARVEIPQAKSRDVGCTARVASAATSLETTQYFDWSE